MRQILATILFAATLCSCATCASTTVAWSRCQKRLPCSAGYHKLYTGWNCYCAPNQALAQRQPINTSCAYR